MASVHGVLQARTLGWVATPSSRASSRPRDRAQGSCIGRRILYLWSHEGSPLYAGDASKLGNVCWHLGIELRRVGQHPTVFRTDALTEKHLAPNLSGTRAGKPAHSLHCGVLCFVTFSSCREQASDCSGFSCSRVRI